METLIIESTKTLPYICFNPHNKEYCIKGSSFPEDPQTAFEPIFKWLQNNLCLLDHKMQIALSPEYFNSASNRMLLKFFRILEVSFQSGKEIEIIWAYEEEEGQNDGLIFSRLVNLPFQFKSKNEDLDIE